LGTEFEYSLASCNYVLFIALRLRWGWVFVERTRILSGIQFTTYFIEIFVMETKRFVGSTVNVILTRQTCGQRSSGAAESKRRAIGNYFPEQICYMFPISKCRGDQDLGLCPSSVLAFGEPQGNGKIREKTSFDVGKIGFCRCASVLQTQVPKLCTALDLSLLYILILGTYSKFARENNFLSLGVCIVIEYYLLQFASDRILCAATCIGDHIRFKKFRAS